MAYIFVGSIKAPCDHSVSLLECRFKRPKRSFEAKCAMGWILDASAFFILPLVQFCMVFNGSLSQLYVFLSCRGSGMDGNH